MRSTRDSVRPAPYISVALDEAGQGGSDVTAQATPIRRRVSIHLDYEEGEGYLLVPPDADPLNLAAVIRLAEVYGWHELDVEETGDEPEVMDDGTTKVLLVREEC